MKPPDSVKLLLTLEDKNNYVVHYGNLQFHISQGMKLKQVHRALEFEQERWMEPYIWMNTEFRKTAHSVFEKNFYKLINNSVFGKTVENLRNRVDIRIVHSSETNRNKEIGGQPFVKQAHNIHEQPCRNRYAQKQSGSEQTCLRRDDDR